MDTGLRGKAVIVTGATANIGRAIALDMASEGARLLAVGRDVSAGQAVVQEAKARGASEAIFLTIDLTDANSGEVIRDRAV